MESDEAKDNPEVLIKNTRALRDRVVSHLRFRARDHHFMSNAHAALIKAAEEIMAWKVDT